MMKIEEKVRTIIENTPKVYEAGKKAEYDAFWDSYQNNGNRKNYRGAFGVGFTPETFKPKYPIIPRRSYDYDSPQSNMFYYTNHENAERIYLTNCPIDLTHLNDTYKGNAVDTVFQNANVDDIFVDLKGVTSVYQLFNYNNTSREPRTVKLRITESLTSITDMFYYMADSSVLTLSFTEDSVLVASLALKQSIYLTKECIQNIFGVMSDDVTGKTLTLKTAGVNYAFGSVDNAEWQALVASKPNWTISLI